MTAWKKPSSAELAYGDDITEKSVSTAPKIRYQLGKSRKSNIFAKIS